MRFATHIVPALLLTGLSAAAPHRKRDSSSGEEVAVSAPFGVVESDTAELSSQLASETGFGAEPTALPVDTASSDSASVSADSTTTTDASLATATDASTIDSSVLASLSAIDTNSIVFPPADTANSVAFPSDTNSVVFPPAETAAPYGPPVVSSGSSYGGSVDIPPYVNSGSSYNMPQYGSGSVSWESSYNSCVQTCMASYPPPPATISLPPSDAPPSIDYGSSVSSGSPDATVTSPSGTVHNIVVAPSQGVLRFVPFSVPAVPGDTIRFTWGAGPHTVTQSSALTPCNATANGFHSGSQNATFVFDQVVNSTDPIWFYCGIPTHCQKGMWGVVNPPTIGAGEPTSVDSMMPTWAASNPDIATTLAYTQNVTSGMPAAANWGASIDVASIDPMYHAGVAKSVLLTRATIAANPDMVDKDGVFRPTGDVKIPTDLSSFLASADGYGAAAGASSSSSGSATGTSTSTSASGTSTSGSNGAASVASSSFGVAAVAVFAAFMML